MDMSTVGTAGGAATAGAIIIKIIDKIPWGKLVGRNGNGNGKAISEVDMKLMVSEHQNICQEKMNKRFDDMKDHTDHKFDELKNFLVEQVLNK